MNANQMNTARGYWLAWFLASAMGYGLGAILGLYFAYGIFDRDPFDILMGVTLGTVMGATGVTSSGSFCASGSPAPTGRG